MKRIRLLKVSFDTPIRFAEISAFRGAIAEKVGLQHEWFHNHNNLGYYGSGTTLDDLKGSKYHYRYPLIQYKTRRENQELKPMIICLGEGVEEAHKFFSKSNWDIHLNGQRKELSISRLDLNQYDVQVWNQEFTYNIFKWLALNQDDFKVYQTLEGLSDRIRFLEEKLVKNMVAFTKGIGLQTATRMEVKILEIKQERFIRFKNNRVQCFDVSFKTNVFLPEYIGLGKGVSKGFGVVRRPSKVQFARDKQKRLSKALLQKIS